MKKNIAVIFGGVSSEHEISIMSVQFVLSNISKEKYNVYKIGITKEGAWFLYFGDIDKIPTGEWQSDPKNKPAIISPDRKRKGLLVFTEDKWELIPIDVVYPVLHGKNGEDGTIQGLFELAGIPYVGCDMIASATCMDKVITNVMLTNGGIEKAKFDSIWDWEYKDDKNAVVSKIEKNLQYPIFVKPSKAGSSVGVSKVNDRDELCKAIEVAIREDNRILFEETIIGKEVECAVLGNEHPIVSMVGEIAPSKEFYDYEAKYLSNTSKLFIPAHLDEEISEKIRSVAAKAYAIMGCTGLSRVDFFVQSGTNRVLLNEINTIPGCTSISMYPKLMENVGVTNSELVERLLEFAVQRARCNDK